VNAAAFNPAVDSAAQLRCHGIDCTLGVCACPRGLTHADPVAAATESHFCSIDPAATPSFLPRVHPLLCNTRCVRTQQYIRANQEVLFFCFLCVSTQIDSFSRLTSVVSSAFSCDHSSKRIMLPSLPLRAFGDQVNYLLMFEHHHFKS
jgi:hypothetical protein